MVTNSREELGGVVTGSSQFIHQESLTIVSKVPQLPLCAPRRLL